MIQVFLMSKFSQTGLFQLRPVYQRINVSVDHRAVHSDPARCSPARREHPINGNNQAVRYPKPAV